MARRTIIATIVFFSIILLVAAISHAGSLTDTLSFSASVGISIPLGNTGDLWGTGFCISGGVFYPFRSDLLIGGCLSYNSWRADEDKFIQVADVAGSASSIEIYPTVKFIFFEDETRSINLFGQGGFSLCRMSFDRTVKDSPIPGDVSIDDSEIRLGFSLGPGIILGKKGGVRYEVVPMYNIVFTEGSSFKYFTLSVGVAFQ